MFVAWYLPRQGSRGEEYQEEISATKARFGKLVMRDGQRPGALSHRLTPRAFPSQARLSEPYITYLIVRSGNENNAWRRYQAGTSATCAWQEEENRETRETDGRMRTRLSVHLNTRSERSRSALDTNVPVASRGVQTCPGVQMVTEQTSATAS
jgi:hypothetical protein